jgi:hypothetical protein
MLQEAQEAAQEASLQTAAAGARTTRATRTRGARTDADLAPATASRTTRRGGAAAVAARQPVPKFEAPTVTGDDEAAAASPSSAPGDNGAHDHDDTENRPAAAAGAGTGAGALSSAEVRAQARIDAKLAALGAAGGAVGRRTAARGALPGEAVFSAMGGGGWGVGGRGGLAWEQQPARDCPLPCCGSRLLSRARRGPNSNGCKLHATSHPHRLCAFQAPHCPSWEPATAAAPALPGARSRSASRPRPPTQRPSAA